MAMPEFPGRSYGLCFTLEALRSLVTPDTQRKIVITSCTSLVDRCADHPLRLFYLAQNGYITASQEAKDLKYRIGDNADVFTMIEVFGKPFPSTWMLTDDDAKPIVFKILKQLFPALIDKVNSFDRITPDLWEQIMNTIDTRTDDYMVKGQFYGSIASVIYSVCRLGSYSIKTFRDLTIELSTRHGFPIILSQVGVTGYWNAIGKTYDHVAIKSIIDNLLQYLKGGICLSDLVKFAKQKGLTLYYQVLQALRSFPEFNWPYVYLYAEKDFKNFDSARKLVQDKDYFGYNADIGIAAAVNYPTLAYVSWKLNETLGGQASLSALKSKVIYMVDRERWDNVIRDYRNKRDRITTIDYLHDLYQTSPKCRKRYHNPNSSDDDSDEDNVDIKTTDQSCPPIDCATGGSGYSSGLRATDTCLTNRPGRSDAKRPRFETYKEDQLEYQTSQTAFEKPPFLQALIKSCIENTYEKLVPD